MAQDTSLRGGKRRPGGAKISPGGAVAPLPPTSRAYDINSRPSWQQTWLLLFVINNEYKTQK